MVVARAQRQRSEDMRRISRSWAATAVAAACTATAAAIAQPVPASLEACVRITEDSHRLACFDREIAALSGGGGSAGAASKGTTSKGAATKATASAGAGAASATAPVATTPSVTPEQKMGLSPEGVHKLEVEKGISPAEAKPPQELAAHLASVSHNSAGRAVFTLDNGQVWRQSETRAHFEAHAGDAVKITHGALGSFWLSTDTHSWTRVERVP